MWVHCIAERLQEHGSDTTVEDESKGVRVDIGLRVHGHDVAVEVELSDGHIDENLRKGRAAGYARTVCLIDSPGALNRLRAKLDVVPADVVVGDLRDFEAILTSVLSSLRPPNQTRNEDADGRRAERRAHRPPRLQRRPCSSPPIQRRDTWLAERKRRSTSYPG